MIHKKSATASRGILNRTEVLISRIVQEHFCYRHATPIRDLERKLGNQILKQASSSEVILRLCCLLLNNAIRNLQAEMSRHSIGTAGTENYNGKTCLLILAGCNLWP